MNKKNLYNVLLIVALVINISFFRLLVGPTYFGWLSNISFIIILFLIPSLINYGTRAIWIYVFSIALGLLLHIGFTDVRDPVSGAARWVFLMVLYMASGKYETWSMTKYFLHAIVAVHCGVAITEYNIQSNIIEYSFVEEFSNFDDVQSFRAFGLMEHPLYAANVLIIFLAFVLVSTGLPKLIRFVILSIGTFALLTFNARAAIVVWFALLTFKLLKTYKIIGSLIVLLVIGVILGELPLGLVVDLSFLGRLAEVGFSDGSSLNRVISFVVFFGEKWDLTDIIAGGRVIFIPGSEYSLESGLLLTIAWWGWIVGVLKIVLELVISYQSISYLKSADRFVVLVACWVTAFANNNSVNTFVLFFMLFCAIIFRQKSQFSGHSFEAYRPNYARV